jgi:hypothetical protein
MIRMREGGRDAPQEDAEGLPRPEGNPPGNYPANAEGQRPENPRDADPAEGNQKGANPNMLESERPYDPDHPQGFHDMVGFVPQRFDPSSLRHDCTLVLFGKRRTGKSYALRELLWYKKDVYPYYLIFTGTKINGFWQKYFPERFIHDGFIPDVLAKFMDMQAKLVDELMQDPNNLDENGELDADRCERNPWKCLVLDDVISEDKAIKYSRLLEQLFTKGRHLKIAVFLASQYAKGVNTVMRGNIDYLITFKQRQVLQMESIAKDFLGDMGVKQAFALLKKYAHGHQAVVMDVANLSADPSETTFVWEAKDPGKFVLGCKEFWEGDRNKALVAQEDHIEREFIPAW